MSSWDKASLMVEDLATMGQTYADAPLPKASSETVNEASVALPRQTWAHIMDLLGWASTFTGADSEASTIQGYVQAIGSQIRGKGI